MQNSYRLLVDSQCMCAPGSHIAINKNLERVRNLDRKYTQHASDNDVISRVVDPPSLIVPIHSYKTVRRSAIVQILKLLRQIEIQEDIIIHYAVEVGSRSYGLNNKESDYDVRFVYSYREIALSSDLMRNFAEKTDAMSDEVQVSNINIDYQGWQLSKYMLMLKKHNATAVELLETPITYLDRQEFKTKMINVLNSFPDSKVSKTMYHHYLQMARSNFESIERDVAKMEKRIAHHSDSESDEDYEDYEDYKDYDENAPLLPNRPVIKYKRYFNVVRPILQAIYIMMSRNESSLNSNLMELLPRIIFNFENLLRYFESRIGVRMCASSQLAELDITDSDCDDLNVIDRRINLDGLDSQSAVDADFKSESSHPSLMMTIDAHAELRWLIKQKRLSSDVKGPVVESLHSWISKCLTVLLDSKDLMNRLDGSTNNSNQSSQSREIILETYKDLMFAY